jgi:asparagine synthase (glutamine-hydrolysing)
MCGIAGFVDRNMPLVERKVRLKAMLDRIRHRGPDDEGSCHNQKVGLSIGMRRLSIIDLTGGHQPIWNENETVGVVFNGEIYNFTELRTLLTGLGHTFKTSSDTEVIVHGYEEFGSSLFSQLRGMFALALFDKDREQLILARDHFGQKPLYYHSSGGRFAFGSEIKALFALGGVPRETNPDAFLDYISWFSLPSPHTHFRGIYSLSPGSSITIDLARPDEVKSLRFWSYIPGKNRDLTKMCDAVEALDATLNESVRLHLQSDVPVGILLSGGLDSRTVTSYAKDHVRQKLRTFSVGFADGESELPEARQTATDFDTQHEDITLKPEDLRDSIEEVAWHLDEPIGDPAAFAMLHVCRLARSKVKVLLGGEGADELFAGYEGRYRGMIHADSKAELIRPLARRLPIKLRRYPLSRFSRLLSRACHSRQVAWVNNRIEGFPGDVRNPVGLTTAQLNHLQLRQLEFASEYCPPLYDQLDEITSLDINWQLPASLLLKADKMSMAASVELRAPYLDIKVAEIAGRIASHLKLPPDGGPGKSVLRRCLAQRSPEPINRPKKGFPVPLNVWLRGPLRRAVEEAVFDKQSASLGVLNRTLVRAAWERFQDGADGLGHSFYALWLYEVWSAVYLKPAERFVYCD